jgi:hypothetical protein
MRYTLLIIFCAISVSASAQFWKKAKKPVPVEEVFPRYDEIPQPSYFSAITVSDIKFPMPGVYIVPFKRTIYEIELAEDMVMTEAKHNMRFREYKLASYNFSDLANLYILQNRFSEAKWYLLQSNAISREQNDDRHTIVNLLNLATIKFAIGEAALAKTDLQEAHDIANAKGFASDLPAIDKRMHDLELNKYSSPRSELRYAQAVEASNKSQ